MAVLVLVLLKLLLVSMSVLVWVAAASDSREKSTLSPAMAVLFREPRPCACLLTSNSDAISCLSWALHLRY